MGCPNPFWAIAHFTVTGGNEAGVGLVLMQLCLLYTLFLYKNTFYKNIEAEICEILRIF